MKNGEVLVSVHAGYDPVRGAVKRPYYRLPGWSYTLTLELHLWYVSTLATILNIFYKHVDVVEVSSLRTYMLLAREPRSTAPRARELPETGPSVYRLRS